MLALRRMHTISCFQDDPETRIEMASLYQGIRIRGTGFPRPLLKTSEVQVVAAVIEDGPLVLVGRCSLGRRHAGMWEFPGGKVEPGETPEQALVREIFEELSLDISVGRLLARVGGAELELWAYQAQIRSGTVCLSDHDEIGWFTKDELGQLEMPELDREIRGKL